MQRKLLGIINVDFDGTRLLLIIYFAFIKKQWGKWEFNEAVESNPHLSFNRPLPTRQTD
jgi:hypothetical protein